MKDMEKLEPVKEYRDVQEIIKAYTAGEMTLEAANAAMEAMGAMQRLNPDLHRIAPHEREYMGLLDTGTGTYDKVEARNGHLVGCDCGEMDAFFFMDGKMYAVYGSEIEEE